MQQYPGNDAGIYACGGENLGDIDIAAEKKSFYNIYYGLNITDTDVESILHAQ
jgi:hypothetical protein